MKLDLMNANLLGFGIDIETGKLYVNVEGGSLSEGLSLRFPKVKDVVFNGSLTETPQEIISQILKPSAEVWYHKISTKSFSLEFKSSTVQRNSLCW